MRIILELEKGVDQNAAIYYDKAKKLKKKIEGVKKAILIAKEKKEKATIERIAKDEKQAKIIKEKERKKHWYEKFRWFISSDGFLVIGGKDAGSNEVVMKKYLDPSDLVYHTDAPGSPFIIIKNPNNLEIPKQTKLEAATQALTFSRVWKLNIKSAEVFEVLPSQVSKEAKSGEFIAKGAFMIYGKRTHYTPSVSLGIGLIKGGKTVMSGPLSAVKINCEQVVALRQGDKKKGEISKLLMKKFDLHTNENIISALPAGNFEVIK